MLVFNVGIQVNVSFQPNGYNIDGITLIYFFPVSKPSMADSASKPATTLPATLGTQLVLKCKPGAGTATAYEFQYKGKTLTAADGVNGDTLTIKSVTAANLGDYTCIAVNGQIKSVASDALKVTGQGKFDTGFNYCTVRKPTIN